MKKPSFIKIPEFLKPPDTTHIRARNAFWVCLILALVNINSVITISIIWLSFPAWQVVGAICIATGLALAGVIGVFYVKQGRVTFAIHIQIRSFLLALFMAGLLIKNIGLIAALGVFVVILVLVTITISREEINSVLILTVVICMLSAGGDFLEPPTQLDVPAIVTFIPISLGGMFLVYSIYVVRQFRTFPLPVKLITTFIIVSLIPLLLVSIFNYFSQTGQADIVTQTLADRATQTEIAIDTFITNNLDSLNAEAQLPILKTYLNLSPEQILENDLETPIIEFLTIIQQKNPTFITSVALLNQQGLNVIDTNSANIGNNESENHYFQQAIKNNNPDLMIWPILHLNTQEDISLYFSQSIVNDKEQMLGVLRIQYNADILQKLITESSNLFREKAFAMLLDKKHNRLADGRNSDLRFTPILTDIETALTKTVSTETEVDIFYFTYVGDDELAAAGNQEATEYVATVKLITQDWIVIFAQPSAELFGASESQFRITLLLANVIVAIAVFFAIAISALLANPIVRLTDVAQQVSSGNLQIQATVESVDETGQLAVAFNTMTTRLRDLINSLEDQVKERTLDLSLSMEVGQKATTIRELDELLPTITEFVRQQFNLYYVQVYFVDDIGQNVVLRSGTGEVGQKLLARHHRLQVGQGIVGRVAAEGQSIVVSNTETSDIHSPNDLLPLTRSELAVPLLAEGKVIGVFDMQATEVDTFTEANLTVFEAMATQLATAIDSAKQWTVAQEAQQKAERAVQQLSREAWVDKLTTTKEQLSYVYDLSAVSSLATDHKQDKSVSTPLMVLNQTVGSLAVDLPVDRQWSEEEQTFLDAIAENLAQKAENLRLFEQSQKRAQRERLTRQIADRVRGAKDIESALKTATEELAKVLNVSRAVIDLEVADSE